VICPVHKKGDKLSPDNYRGISQLNIIGKIFTKLVNNSLVAWANENNKLYEQQGGFRRGYACVYTCFTLQAMVQKYTSTKKGRMYCLFVDFSKAFDCTTSIIVMCY
jgi:hypothetical protein